MKKRLFALFLALAMLCIAVPLGVLAEDGSDNDFPYGDISGCKDGHTWGEWQTIKAATCTEPGEQTHTCAKCGKVETGVIAALGHVEVEEVTPATCTEDGKRTVRCSRCNEELFGETLPATGHKFSDWVYADETHHTHTCPSCSTEETEEHTWDEGVITQEPTATEEGVKTFTCSKCNETKTEPVAALGHDLTKTEAKEATCEEAGNSAYYTCARCGKFFSDEKGETEIEKDSWIISAKKHQYTETVTKEPTCTEAGEKTFTCSACGDSYTESLDPLGHAAEKETVVKEATCTEDGEKAYVCSRCNEVLRTEVISAKGHEFDADWTVDQPATADAIGVKSRHCRNCDATTDVEYLPMLPHELKVESDGKTYCYVDGEKFMGGRLRLDGKWYHFSDVDGHMMLGFETLANGKIRYYEENNYWWRFGVAEIDGEHYFFDGDGYLITGEGEPDANGFTWYVYHINGTDVYYALDPANNYAWVYGLKEVDGATYYYPQYATFKGPAKGVVSVNGVWMNFDETTGEKLVGWVKTAEGTRYYEDGYYWYKTGFIQILEEGETTENGKYYFFDYDTGYLFAPDESEWEYGMAWYVYTINGTNIYYAMDPENGFCWVTGEHTVKDGTTYNFVKWATVKQPEVVNPTEASGN